MLYISVLFFINIASVSMQTTTIEIKDLDSLISSSLDRLLEAIDPTIDKFQNSTIEILSVLENRIKVNIWETFYWLETNLFVLLFVVIVFFIFMFILLNLLDILLIRYGYKQEERRFLGLAVITLIFVWLLIAMILSTWPLANKFDLQTLKYVLVVLLSLIVLYLIIIWICYLYDHCKQLRGHGASNKILVKGTPINTQENLELESVRL